MTRAADSRGHRVTHMGGQDWILSWTTDRKYAGSRLRFPRVFQRIADEYGARRFAKKWGLLPLRCKVGPLQCALCRLDLHGKKFK